MKFIEFLNEMPHLDNDIKPVPTAVQHSYNNLIKDESDDGEFKDHKFKSYIIRIFDINGTAFLIDKDDSALIMTEYSLDDYLDDYLFQNTSLEKGTTAKFEKNLVAEFVIELAKLLRANGIISDTTQSIGGKKTWEIIVDSIGDKSKEVGVYDNEEVSKSIKEKSMKSNEWFKTVSKNVYGGDDKERYQLYIIF